MQSVEELRDKIDAAEGLQQVVKTMKGMAAVNIRQYQRADESLAEYAATVEQGLQILLSTAGGAIHLREDVGAGRGEATLAVVFGSDQGLVGQFNSRIVRHAFEVLESIGAPRDRRRVLAIGRRLAGRLAAEDEEVVEAFDLPRSADAIAGYTRRLLPAVQRLRDQGARRVIVLHHLPVGGASYRAVTRHVFPLSLQWLADLRDRPWPGPSRPMARIDPGAMLAHLVGQYLFVSLFRAFAGSLAAENASRLASMQAAERNIDDRLDALRATYHRQRQGQITAELLDVMAGFEAAKK
ncbi:MAG: F0F1 ATP synthase subunit gamma [Planctomycetota bacterium]